ncbi:MAG: BRO family protein [Clostridium sp.]
MKELMIFEGKEVEVFELGSKILFNPKHVGKCLELTVDATSKAVTRMNNRQVIKVKNSDISEGTNCLIRKLNNAGENFITEAGVYKMIFASRSKGALRFQDWVTDEVLPSIRKNQYYISKNITNENITKLEIDLSKAREKIKLLNGEIRQHKFFEKQITGAWITVNWDLDTYRVGNIVMEMDFVKSFIGKYLNKQGFPKIDRESIQRVRFMNYRLEISKLCLQSILGAYSNANINTLLK